MLDETEHMYRAMQVQRDIWCPCANHSVVAVLWTNTFRILGSSTYSSMRDAWLATPDSAVSAQTEEFTCMVWDKEALKGRKWDRIASPSTRSVSMIVSWKYASRETAST